MPSVLYNPKVDPTWADDAFSVSAPRGRPRKAAVAPDWRVSRTFAGPAISTRMRRKGGIFVTYSQVLHDLAVHRLLFVVGHRGHVIRPNTETSKELQSGPDPSPNAETFEVQKPGPDPRSPTEEDYERARAYFTKFYKYQSGFDYGVGPPKKYLGELEMNNPFPVKRRKKKSKAKKKNAGVSQKDNEGSQKVKEEEAPKKPAEEEDEESDDGVYYGPNDLRAKRVFVEVTLDDGTKFDTSIAVEMYHQKSYRARIVYRKPSRAYAAVAEEKISDETKIALKRQDQVMRRLVHFVITGKGPSKEEEDVDDATLSATDGENSEPEDRRKLNEDSEDSEESVEADGFVDSDYEMQ